MSGQVPYSSKEIAEHVGVTVRYVDQVKGPTSSAGNVGSVPTVTPDSGTAGETQSSATYACRAANKSHGLRRTNADKQKAVKVALELSRQRAARGESPYSNREIAEHVGVGSRMVDGMNPVHTGGKVRESRNETPDSGTDETSNCPTYACRLCGE